MRIFLLKEVNITFPTPYIELIKNSVTRPTFLLRASALKFLG